MIEFKLKKKWEKKKEMRKTILQWIIVLCKK
jgi:hypothetical protein